MQYRVGVGGATGNVGREMLQILEQRAFPISSFHALASKQSAQSGRTVRFNAQVWPLKQLSNFDFSQLDLLFLSAGAEVSRDISPRAAAAGCIVIDNSSAFRMEPSVPLVVPEVNGHLLDDFAWQHTGILPVANCSTIQLVMALKPLHDAARVRRVVVSTYQSAAGGGRRMLDRLMSQADPVELNMRDLHAASRAALETGSEKPIAFNVVPHIDIFLKDGRTKEEWKMEVETRRILESPDLPVSATCVRVPVFVGHAEAVHVEFETPLDVSEARALLQRSAGVNVVDERRTGGYITPMDCAGQDAVFVSRIRRDASVPNGLILWIVADNIRKGAALNAVQIAEALIAKHLLPSTRR